MSGRTAGFTFAEKALARAAGVSSARAGDVLDVQPDVILSHDNPAAIRRIFEQIRAAAFEVRALLDEVGLVAFPKTTGNRGLHIYAGLEPQR